MNLLKKTTVTGELFKAYAKVTIKYDFENQTKQRYSPRYIFSIPEGAGVTGIQLLTENKTLIRGKITPFTDTSFSDFGYRLRQIDNQLYCLEIKCLDGGAVASVLVECIVSLLPRENGFRFYIPLGLSLPDIDLFCATDADAEIDLTLNGLAPYRLRQNETFNSTDNTFMAQVKGNEDFYLDLIPFDHGSFGIARQEFNTGLAFYRIYSDAMKGELKFNGEIQLLLDLSGAKSYERGSMVKELFFKVASAIPKGTLVQILVGENCQNQTTSINDDFLHELFLELQDLSVTESLDDLLCYAERLRPDDAVAILVTDGCGVMAEETFRKLKKPIHLFTIGEFAKTMASQAWDIYNIGKHKHFYSGDFLEEEIKSGLRDLLYNEKNEQVVVEGGVVHETLAMPYASFFAIGYRDILVKYSGRPPQAIAIWRGGQMVGTLPLPNVDKLPNLPIIEHIYAMEKTRQLNELLKKATPVSVRSIKKQLNEVGIRFGLLNSETILTIEIENDGEAGIPILNLSGGISSKTNRRTIFGEDDNRLNAGEKEKLLSRYIELLTKSIREDGSIVPDDRINKRDRAEITALSVLTLLVLKRQELSVVTEDALGYLKNNPAPIWGGWLDYWNNKKSLPRQLLEELPSWSNIKECYYDLETMAKLLLRFYFE